MKVILKDVRLSFPDLFTAQAMKNSDGTTGTPKFSAHFLIEKGSANEKAMKEAMIASATDKWGPNGNKVLGTIEASKRCLRDGDMSLDKAGEVRNGYAGMSYVQASNKARPTVINKDKSPVAEADGIIYGGCYVNAIVDVYALDKPGIGKGVFATLMGVQFSKPGDSFGGVQVASVDDFETLPETTDDLGF